MDGMTPPTNPSARIAEIDARLKAATPGPWKEGYSDGSGKFDLDRHACISASNDEPILHGDFVWPADELEGHANLILVVNAPSDIAWLIERVRELEAGMADAIDTIHGEFCGGEHHPLCEAARKALEGKVTNE